MNPMRPVANRLRHGVVGGDPATAPRCNARTRDGTPCEGPCVCGRKRCRLHGGKSTGPRTREGREIAAAARLVHGGRSSELAKFLRELRASRDEAAIAVAHALSRYLPPEARDDTDATPINDSEDTTPHG
jgi:hypothetical protein